MSISRTIDSFTYYDTLSNLVPGLTFLWALYTIGPFPEGVFLLLVTGNSIVDSILMLALAYVVGHVLQFLSRCSVEPLLKRIFWKGEFFSDIFLVETSKQCSKVELSRYISFAETKLGFSKESTAMLLDPNAMSDENKKRSAVEVSRAIYRTVDAKSQDTSTAQKAHVQNTFYSFFRNLSALFLILTILDVTYLVRGQAQRVTLMTLLNAGLTVVFLLLAKQRGENYVRGLFWSYV